MAICRNTFGKLAYTMTTKNGVFSCSRDKSGRNRILSHKPYYSTNACINVGLILPDKIPPFESFIQAVSYMKRNADNLR